MSSDPTFLQQLHYYNDLVASIAGIILSTFFLTFLLAFRRESHRSATKILAIGASFDLAYSLLTLATKAQIVLDQGFLYLIPQDNNDLAHSFGMQILLHLWMAMTFGNLAVIACQFTIRYRVINQNKPIRKYRYTLVFGILLIFFLLQCSVFQILAFWPFEEETQAALEVLKNGDISIFYRNNMTSYIASSTRDPFLIAYLVMGLIFTIGTFALIILLAYEMWLESQNKLFQSKKQPLQMRLFKILLLQSIIPLIICLSIGIIIVGEIFNVDSEYIDILPTLPFAWSPTFCVLIALFAIRNIVEKHLRKIMKDPKKIFQNKTTSTPAMGNVTTKQT